MADPYYITTAIHLPNGRPHIGHAYEMIAADAIARFQRQAGRDVRFQTGTDEHGLKMAQTARTRGIDVRAFADEMSSYFSAMADTLNISYDRSSAPSNPITMRPARRSGRRCAMPATCTSIGMRAGIRCATRPSTTRRNWWRGKGAPSCRPRYARGVDRRRDVVLPPVEISAAAARPVRRQPRFHPPRGAPQRGDALRRGRSVGLVGVAHQLRLGGAGARQPRARHVCVGRCADQLFDRWVIPTMPRRWHASGPPICI